MGPCGRTDLPAQSCTAVAERGDDHLALLRVLAAVLQLLLRVAQALAQGAQCVVAALQLRALGLQVALKRHCLCSQTQDLFLALGYLWRDTRRHA